MSPRKSSEAKTQEQKIAEVTLDVHNLKHLFNDTLRYFQTFVKFTGNEKKFKEYVEQGNGEENDR